LAIKDDSVPAPSEGVAAKLARELDLFSEVGAKSRDRVQHAVDNPIETAVKVGAAAALGVGLAVMTRNPGPLKLAAESLGLGFGAATGVQLVGGGRELGSAMQSSWITDRDQAVNRARVSDGLAAIGVDTILMGTGGALGSISTQAFFSRQAARMVEIPMLKLGQNADMTHTLAVGRYSEMGRLYTQMSNRVGRLEVLAQPRGADAVAGRYGSAFAVGRDGKLVTNHHVVDNALEVTVFDGTGRAHKASVLATSELDDLAVIQLKDRRSIKSFEPVDLGTSAIIKGNQGQDLLYSMGFPNGWQRPYLSPGSTIKVGRVDPLNMKILLHSENGNSGGPIFDNKGKLVGILKQSERSNADHTLMTPVERLNVLLESLKTSEQSRARLPVAVASHHRYTIGDPAKAKANLQKLFTDEMLADKTGGVFHSKITRTPINAGDGQLQELVLRTQYRPASREVVVEPIAVGNKALDSEALEAVWPGTNIKIKDASLTLKLDRNLNPVSMTATNDPTMALKRAFDYKSSGNYLSGLVGIQNATTLGFKTRNGISGMLQRFGDLSL
jgi:hypothetical protein